MLGPRGPRMKYIVVTGGVLSGLGKGITASSIGRLLKARGLKVTAVKIDPYVNCDAGTMNPFEHGEVFVLDDGGEADLDLGNYERFLDVELGRDNNITTGKVYRAVIEKERRGEYLGKTVQIVPHVTTEIRDRIKRAANSSGADVCLIEAGGTVGDIESMPFLEALRQLRREVGEANVAFVHCTLVPVMGTVGEQKTKPTQHSVSALRAIGIDPDMLVCRSEEPLDPKVKEKLALFCDVDPGAVISAPDARTIYEVPQLLEAQGVADWLIERLGLQQRAKPADLQAWTRYTERILNPRHTVHVAVVGKYTQLADAYLSISEAFRHAGAELWTRVEVTWVDAEQFERGAKPADVLGKYHAILVPGGFGSRGAEGKIKAIQHAREAKVPYLGICFGFQLAVCEYARHVLGIGKANSTEIDPGTPDPVIDILPEQRSVQEKGGTMRLGGSPILVKEGTLAHRLYGEAVIRERHRHRYEVNPEYIPRLEKAGLVFSGKHTNGVLMEIAELPEHPYFIGGQFHPEFKSRPERPAPLFLGLVEAALKRQTKAA
ncbi:MAG: CTP synthase (glutamine hydrolyzing) [Halobacteriales archaeon]|nr:CTP synthase (glutamine hydrolyzing) [Halobacteriales archaeon]